MPLAPSAVLTLRFHLPEALRLCVGPGRWHPCIHRARVDVGEDGDVEIRAEDGLESEARRVVFDQAQRFLISIAGGRHKLPQATMPAWLYSSSRPERADNYSIVTGAAVSITRAIERPVIC